MNTDGEQERIRLQHLDQTLSPNLPPIPKFLLELVKNERKLSQIRGNADMHNSDGEKKQQGQLLESFRKSLVELDLLHKKSIIEIKALQEKLEKVKKIQEIE